MPEERRNKVFWRCYLDATEAKLLASEAPDIENRLFSKVSAMCFKAAKNQPNKNITMGARYLYFGRLLQTSMIDFERRKAQGFWIIFLNIKPRFWIYR